MKKYLSSLALRNAASVRDSRCAAENIYFSGELRNRNQSLTTIQRTHTIKIKTTSTPCWSEGIELKQEFPTPSPRLVDLKSSSLYNDTCL